MKNEILIEYKEIISNMYTFRKSLRAQKETAKLMDELLKAIINPEIEEKEETK